MQSQFFPGGIWLEQHNDCLKVFCLTRVALSCPFGEREQAFGGGFSCTLWHFWVVYFSNTLFGICEKKTNPGNSSLWDLCPKVSSQSSSFSPHFRVFLCLFIYNVQGFKTVLSMRNRRKYEQCTLSSLNLLSSGKKTSLFYKQFQYKSRQLVLKI